VARQLNGSAAVIDSLLGHRVGFWNPSIYSFATLSHSPFTPLDLSGTSNDNDLYRGTPGTLYNPATGLGVRNLAVLAAEFGSRGDGYEARSVRSHGQREPRQRRVAGAFRGELRAHEQEIRHGELCRDDHAGHCGLGRRLGPVATPHAPHGQVSDEGRLAAVGNGGNGCLTHRRGHLVETRDGNLEYPGAAEPRRRRTDGATDGWRDASRGAPEPVDERRDEVVGHVAQKPQGDVPLPGSHRAEARRR
jgi:hypothetical protein